jgi:PAS domain S-box-containing protein
MLFWPFHRRFIKSSEESEMQDEHKTKAQLMLELHELRERVAECEKDKVERKRAEESLREREERFSLAMEATKDGLWDWNLNTDEVYFSPGYIAMLGYASSEIPAHFSSWADRIHPEDKEAALKANMDCIENRRDDFEVEFRMQARNMEWHWILGRGKAVRRDENGRAVRMVGTHTDISERKRVEEALRASEAEYRDIFENATEGIYRVTPEGSRFLTANPAAARILGYESPEELISTITDIATQIYAYPEEREEALKLMKEQAFLKDFDVRCRHKDGSTVWCSFSARIVRDEQGNTLYHEGTSKDITDRKKAEEALRASEERHRTILHTAIDGFCLIDMEGRLMQVNDAYCRMSGYSEQELLAMSVSDLETLETTGDTAAHIQKVIAQAADRFETSHRRKDGSIFDIEVSAQHLPASGGRIVAFMRDVSERKRAEEALQHSQQMLQNVLDNFPGVVFWKDRDLVYMGCNRAFAKAAGLNAPSEITGKTDYDMPWAEWEAEEYRYADREVTQSGDSRLRIEESQHEADGRVRWYETSKVPLFDAKGDIIGVLGVSGDISERRQAEEAVRESQALLSATIESIPFEFWAIGQDGRYILVNAPCIKHYGDIRGQKPEEICPNQEVLSIWEDNNRRAFRGELVDGEVKSVFEEEEVIYYNIIAPIHYGDEIQGILGLNIDITERKRMEEELRRAYDELESRVQERTAELERANEALRAEIARREQTEEALREAEKKYRSLFENAREGIYQSTPEGNYFTVNPAMARSYGYSSPEEMIGSIASIDHQIFVIPEKCQELGLILETKGEVNDFEVQQRRKDGSIFWASLNVHAAYAEEGSILYWEGRSVDITERKRAEEALKQSEEQLRFLSSRLLEAQEEERKRIAGELHDSIGQSLAAIKFNVENVLKETGKNLNGRIVNSLQQIIPLVQNSMQEVRRIYTGLRPSMLDDLGIIATIGWFCREYQKTYLGICFEHQMRIEEEQIPEPLKIVIFRIVQEALNNIAKHSGAELVNVCLERKDGRIELAIEDNGSGFDVDSAQVKGSHERGFGIPGMKERTEFAGGAFSIESVIGKGTTIHATWPSNDAFS